MHLNYFEPYHGKSDCDQHFSVISMVFNEETKRKEVKTTEDLLQILKDGLRKRWQSSQHAAGVRANAKSKKKKEAESAPPAQPLEKAPLRECPIVYLYIRDQHQGQKEVLNIKKFSEFAEFHFLGDKLVARPKRQRPPVVGKVTTKSWKTTDDRFGRVFNKTNEKIGFNATNLPERPENDDDDEDNDEHDPGQLEHESPSTEERSSPNESSSRNESSPIATPSGTQSSQASGKKRSPTSTTEGAPSKKAKTTADPKKTKGSPAAKKPKATKSKPKVAAAKKAPATKKAPASKAKKDDASKNVSASKKDGTVTGKRSVDTILSSAAEAQEEATMTSLDTQSNMEPSTMVVSSTPDSSSKRARTLSVSLVSPQTSTSGKIKTTKTTNTNTKTTQPSEKDVTSSNNHTNNSAELDMIHTLSIMSDAAQSRLAEIGDSNTKQSSFNNKRSHSTAFIHSKAQDGLKSVPANKNKSQQHTPKSKKQKTNADKEGEGSGLVLDSEMTDVEDEPVEMEWEV